MSRQRSQLLCPTRRRPHENPCWSTASLQTIPAPSRASSACCAPTAASLRPTPGTLSSALRRWARASRAPLSSVRSWLLCGGSASVAGTGARPPMACYGVTGCSPPGICCASKRRIDAIVHLVDMFLSEQSQVLEKDPQAPAGTSQEWRAAGSHTSETAHVALRLHAYMADDPRCADGFIGMLRPYRGLVEANARQDHSVHRSAGPEPSRPHRRACAHGCLVADLLLLPSFGQFRRWHASTRCADLP